MRSSVIVSCFVISYCLIVQISSRIFRMTFCEIVEVNLAWQQSISSLIQVWAHHQVPHWLKRWNQEVHHIPYWVAVDYWPSQWQHCCEIEVEVSKQFVELRLRLPFVFITVMLFPCIHVFNVHSFYYLPLPCPFSTFQQTVGTLSPRVNLLCIAQYMCYQH